MLRVKHRFTDCSFELALALGELKFAYDLALQSVYYLQWKQLAAVRERERDRERTITIKQRMNRNR